MKKVDTHAHIFDASGLTVADARYSPTYSASVHAFIEQLNLHDLEYGVLIQPSFLGYDNSQMLAGIAAYLNRLKGIAVVPTTVSLKELQQLKTQGVVGARLNLFGKPIPSLSNSEWQGFLEKITAVNWQLEIHCPPTYLLQMMPALQRFSGPIVLDHFGRIDPNEGVMDPVYQAILEQLDPARYWVKVSGYYRLGNAQQSLENAQLALQALLKKQMASRLIWGSDWPHTQYEQQTSYNQTVNFLYNLVTDPVLLQKILSQNALSLYGFVS